MPPQETSHRTMRSPGELGDGDSESPPPATDGRAAPESAAPPLTLAQHLAISSFWFANNLHWSALMLVLVPNQAARLSSSVGVSEGQITGWTLAFGAIVGAVVPPVVGAFSDRCTLPLGRRRPYVLGGTLLNLAALALFYLAFVAGSLPGYIAAWMLLGLGNNIAVGAFSGIIPDVVPPAQRGLASSWMAAMQQLGTLAAFLLGALLLPVGREQDLAALGVVALALALVTLITLAGTPERPIPSAPPFRWSELAACFWIDPRRHPDFAWVWITRAFFTAGWFLVSPFLQYFMRDIVGAVEYTRAFSIVGGIVLLAAIPTGILGGVLSDRAGRKRIIFAAALTMTAACLLFLALALLPREARGIAVYGVALLWGAGYGAYLSVDWALATDVLPNPKDAGKDMGVWHLSMVLPQAVAPPVGALLLEPFRAAGGYAPAGYALLLSVAAVCMFLCGALVFRVRRAR